MPPPGKVRAAPTPSNAVLQPVARPADGWVLEEMVARRPIAHRRRGQERKEGRGAERGAEGKGVEGRSLSRVLGACGGVGATVPIDADV